MANEGEGSRTAARRYNEAQTQFAKSGQVDAAARAAEKAIDGPEGESLRKAEEEGKRRRADTGPRAASST